MLLTPRLLAASTLALMLPLTAQSKAVIQEAPLVSIASQDAFFDSIKRLCGKAFAGKVVVDTPQSGGFDGELIMHVRRCSDSELQIPFHVGDDHSRTWIIRKTGSGLSLKHDHRNSDGSYDTSTM